MDIDQHILNAQATIRQRQESMLTSVKSLLQTGKIDEARETAKHLRGSPLWDEVAELLKPTEQAMCQNHHPTEWGWAEFLVRWLPKTCETCEAERHAARHACRKAEAEAREAMAKDRQRTYRDRAPEEVLSALEQIGIPSRFRSAVVKQLEPLTDSLYLSGPRGTGKTHRAAAMARELVLDTTPSQPPSIQWVSAVDLLLAIRASFRETAEQTEEALISQYSDCGLLILDDLGAEKTTEWSLQTLYTIIDRRYREERQTIITSNLSLDELAEKLDDRIASRLSELCRVIVLTGPDRRAQKKGNSH